MQPQKHIGYVYLDSTSSIRHKLFLRNNKTYYINTYINSETPLNVPQNSLNTALTSNSSIHYTAWNDNFSVSNY